MWNLDVSISPQNTQGKWTAEDVALIFSRLVIHGVLANDLSPELAEQWATKSAHYGRLALADLEVRAEGWRVIQGAGGVR